MTRILPFIFVALIIVCIGSIITAFATGEWRWLAITVICGFILANPTS